MSALTVNLPDSLLKTIRRLAKAEGDEFESIRE